MPLKLTATPSHRKVAPEIERSAVGICKELRSVFRALIDGKSPWPLYLFGPAGGGKTCAALALLDYVDGLKSLEEFCYFTAYQLSFRLEQARAGRLTWSGDQGRGTTVWPEAMFRYISRAPLVIVEEVGTRGTVTDAQYDLLKEILDIRSSKPLIVTSNVSLDALAKVYDGRIVSRLAAGTVFELAELDRRLE